MFEFIWPYVFVALPLLWLVERFSGSQQEQQSEQLLNTSLPFTQQQAVLEKTNSPLKQGLKWLVWLLCLVAFARPVWLDDQVQGINEQGRDLLLSVDMSGSMQIKDMQLNDEAVDRLTALKVLLKGFIEQRRGDRVGMILFADHAYLSSPLSFDMDSLLIQVDELVHGLVGDRTAIGEGIGLGIKQLMNHPAEQRILILLTDGQNTSGTVDPMQAAEMAAKNQVVIYTIGVGADELLQQTLFGTRKVNPSHDLDEESLQKIADMTGGQYYRARSTDELAQIYEEINALNPISEAEQYYRPQYELYYWPLALAALVLLISLAAPLISQRFSATKEVQ
ncbi:VWA domain-containing protein [Agarivorans sp. 1_MG-2023]|uniref:VWA domain-containing protein n=1 Tax=Agarivorans sp. 1_MG-2023 TaxID=3062634 RepID=UPI0026E2A52E|nr:VWA domain-containing protein [Agarivorans sp. 1_MG-2023]MDO6763982.1 VWA domain-containing protein [Agarivorans sp. 1_MG-2023]